MGQDIQSQQPIPCVSLDKESKSKLFARFLWNHKILFVILCLLLIFILFVLFSLLFIPNIKISEADNRYSILIKSDSYRAVFTDPYIIYPHYSKAQNEFGNKIILIRNDVPKPMQEFLMIRGAYYFYFSNVSNNLIREMLSDIPGFIRHPLGLGNLLEAKLRNNQFGYSQEKKNAALQKTLTESQPRLTEVKLIGEIVELMDKINAFRVVLLDPKTFKVVVENNSQKQAIVYFGKTSQNNNEARLFDSNGNPVVISYFDTKGIVSGKYVVKITGQGESNEQPYTTVYAQEIRQTPWMIQHNIYKVSLVYPSFLEPGIRDKTTDSFFTINPIDSRDLNEAASDTANINGVNDFHPYGSTPEFKQTKISGQDAILIIPSGDQSNEEFPRGTRAIVIKYPTPLKTENRCREWDCAPGQTTYTTTFEYVGIAADKNNFQTILDSIEFIQ